MSHIGDLWADPYTPHHPPGHGQVRAKDVAVLNIHQAVCQITGCPWSGQTRNSYQEASSDREKHLDWHREQQAASETGSDEGWVWS